MKSLLSVLLCSVLGSVAMADLTIYTDRPTARLASAIQLFEAQTGTSVTVVEEPYTAILSRLQAEGSTSPADLIFTKDLVYLQELAANGYFQPMNSVAVAQDVDASMRDPQGLWTAVSKRARTIVYNPARVDASELSTYEDLASEKWAGRLCLRTSKSSYNDALVGSLIVNNGYEKAKEIVNGWVYNLAIDPTSNDTKVLEAIANGVCDVGIANSYYLAGILAQNPNFPVKIFFANQNSTGTHVNGAGLGISASSQQADLAAQFIEIMLTDKIQLEMSASHLEYPAKTGLLPDTFIKDWGVFNADSANWSMIGEQTENARQLMQETEYN